MVVTVIIVALAGLYLIGKLSATASRTKQRSQHHDRCAYCQTRLHKLPGKATFAEACHRCGRIQPWASIHS